MLLDTHELLKRCEPTPYTELESVKVESPQELPPEFAEKLGEYHFPQPYIFELDDVELSGPICVCTWDGDTVLDVGYFGRLDTWDRNRAYFNQAVVSKRQLEPRHVERACSLMGVWSGNYFHWTLEVLPLLEAVDKWQLESKQELTLLLEMFPRPWAFQSLEALGFHNYKPIESLYYKVDKLIVPTVRRRDGYTYPSAIRWLQKRNTVKPDKVRRLYISRNDAARRRVVNESEVIRFLTSQGFTTVTFTGMPWHEQVSLIKGADVIVAPHGAGLVNCVYNERKPVIIELATPEYLNPCFMTMAAAMGSPYRLVVCQPEPGENIRVDVKELERIL